MIGIYKITAPDGKVYIGASGNIKQRISSHKCAYPSGYGSRLDQSYLLHGAKNHKFEVLEECLKIELPTKERYWQDCYDVLGENGLNCKLTGTPNLNAVVSSWMTNKLTRHAEKRREFLFAIRSPNPELILNFKWGS